MATARMAGSVGKSSAEIAPEYALRSDTVLFGKQAFERVLKVNAVQAEFEAQAR